MSMNENHVDMLIRAGLTVRYHTEPEMPKQTVAEHVFNMLTTLSAWCPDAPADVYRIILFHDAPETVSGDTPATAKWANPNLKRELDKIEYEFWEDYGPRHDIESHDEWLRIVKALDTLELLWYCQKHQGVESVIVDRIENAIGILIDGRRWPATHIFWTPHTKSRTIRNRSCGTTPTRYRIAT